MKWLQRRRERRVLRILAAYGPCEERDIRHHLGYAEWVENTLTELSARGCVRRTFTAGFTGGFYKYDLKRGN